MPIGEQHIGTTIVSSYNAPQAKITPFRQQGRPIFEFPLEPIIACSIR